MKKRIAIIDIGSNSARLVIFEHSSQFGFQLICEEKSKVRIGEGAYAKGGYLQPHGLERAFLALQSFIRIAKNYHVSKVLCVATSALRDAPNGSKFTKYIQQTLGLKIEIIDGNKEAFYGGVSTTSLLGIEDCITIDIGGGSSDLARIVKGRVVETHSLDIGTVRLKELFFDSDKSSSVKKSKEYIATALAVLPATFRHKNAIGIGGTARALGKMLMKHTSYPLNKIHGFSYLISEHQVLFNDIVASSAKGLKRFKIKQDRFDTIREGTLIFSEILKHINAKKVTTSGVGVREGVFLSNSFKKYDFKTTPNPSITSIMDRFGQFSLEKTITKRHQYASRLQEILAPIAKGTLPIDTIQTALTLSDIGKNLTVYKAHHHAFYIALQELNYRFSHEQIATIAFLLRAQDKAKIKKKLYIDYKLLLPAQEDLRWGTFIYTLSLILGEYGLQNRIDFNYNNQTLTITTKTSLYLAKEAIKKIEKPASFAIIIKDANLKN